MSRIGWYRRRKRRRQEQYLERYESICARKIPHASQAEAWKALVLVAETDERYYLLICYKCPLADHFHIGHAYGYRAELLADAKRDIDKRMGTEL